LLLSFYNFVSCLLFLILQVLFSHFPMIELLFLHKYLCPSHHDWSQLPDFSEQILFLFRQLIFPLSIPLLEQRINPNFSERTRQSLRRPSQAFLHPSLWTVCPRHSLRFVVDIKLFDLWLLERRVLQLIGLEGSQVGLLIGEFQIPLCNVRGRILPWGVECRVHFVSLLAGVLVCELRVELLLYDCYLVLFWPVYGRIPCRGFLEGSLMDVL